MRYQQTVVKPCKDCPNMRGTPPQVRDNARELRVTMTQAERLLWNCLRDRKLGGLKFRRQHTVGPYVLDFYCPTAKLGIEVDGGIHKALSEYDEERTAHLNRYGYRIIRFTNEEVLGHPECVLKRILDAAGKAGDPQTE